MGEFSNASNIFDVGGIWMELLPMVTLDKGISYVSGLVSAVDETLSVNEVKEEGKGILYTIKILF
jgi:hypothetical protein